MNPQRGRDDKRWMFKLNRMTRLLGLSAAIIAVAGGLWQFSRPSRAAESSAAVATSCGGFAADAQRLFSKSDAAAMSGTFAPGDHVRLVISFTGVGYSWELTGVLAMANKARVTGAGDFTSVTRSVSTDAPTSIYTTSRSIARSFGLSVVHDVPAARFEYTSERKAASRGEISGFARLEMDIDVTAAGDGTIKIDKADSVPLPLPPRIVSASCIAATTAPSV